MKSEDSFSQINELIRHFSELRDWDQFHTPKNLILAATSEMGELAEVLQWKSDDEVIEYLSSQSGKDRISEEIADVAIYLIRLCQKSNIDFIEAIRSKLSINESRYPAEKSKGKSKKYNELDKL
jgi:dCTP diphosphatase